MTIKENCWNPESLECDKCPLRKHCTNDLIMDEAYNKNWGRIVAENAKRIRLGRTIYYGN